MATDLRPRNESGSSALFSKVDASAEARKAELIELRHHLHAHPELSNREVNTAALIAGRLRDLGVDEVRTGIAGHGVVGVLRGGLPGERVAALRADMDALPVKETSGVPFASTAVDTGYPGGPFPVAHACGHDCHIAAVLTAAGVLADVREQLPGTAVFIFQPAEEGPPVTETGGAKAMLDSGVFADLAPTFVFGMHVSPLPKGTVGYAVGTIYAASCLLKITIEGQQVHASSPWLGVDPMPAAAGIISGIGQVYRQVRGTDAVTVSIGHVEDVGRFNIIGQTVTLWGTIRCLSQADMDLVQERVRRLAGHQAASFGCQAQVEYLQPVAPVVNTPEHINSVVPALERVIGKERILADFPPSLGYDDVSVFIHAFGGVYLFYGVQDTQADDGDIVPAPGGRGMIPNHNPKFYADDDSLLDSVRIHAHVAIGRLLGQSSSHD